RARDMRPNFALAAENVDAVAAICIRLDGLPLAIELAAGRMRVLPPTTLLQRLSQRLPLLTGGAPPAPARHQTLRDTIAWSYTLLEPAEQGLFRRLGIFAGGFTLEAVEAVCMVSSAAVEALEALTSLVEKSLVQQTERAGEARFSLLAT